jgi:hypothetical protein
MQFIIVYNPGQRNFFIESSYTGFIETFSTFEDAENVAQENVNGNEIKSYEIYELSKS